jgi:hypothetical protein
MRRARTETVRDVTKADKASPGPARTTKQQHQRLLRALSDRRLKRAFSN